MWLPIAAAAAVVVVAVVGVVLYGRAQRARGAAESQAESTSSALAEQAELMKEVSDALAEPDVRRSPDDVLDWMRRRADAARPHQAAVVPGDERS